MVVAPIENNNNNHRVEESAGSPQCCLIVCDPDARASPSLFNDKVPEKVTLAKDPKTLFMGPGNSLGILKPFGRNAERIVLWKPDRTQFQRRYLELAELLQPANIIGYSTHDPTDHSTRLFVVQKLLDRQMSLCDALWKGLQAHHSSMVERLESALGVSDWCSDFILRQEDKGFILATATVDQDDSLLKTLLTVSAEAALSVGNRVAWEPVRQNDAFCSLHITIKTEARVPLIAALVGVGAILLPALWRIFVQISSTIVYLDADSDCLLFLRSLNCIDQLAECMFCEKVSIELGAPENRGDHTLIGYDTLQDALQGDFSEPLRDFRVFLEDHKGSAWLHSDLRRMQFLDRVLEKLDDAVHRDAILNIRTLFKEGVFVPPAHEIAGTVPSSEEQKSGGGEKLSQAKEVSEEIGEIISAATFSEGRSAASVTEPPVCPFSHLHDQKFALENRATGEFFSLLLKVFCCHGLPGMVLDNYYGMVGGAAATKFKKECSEHRQVLECFHDGRVRFVNTAKGLLLCAVPNAVDGPGSVHFEPPSAAKDTLRGVWLLHQMDGTYYSITNSDCKKVLDHYCGREGVGNVCVFGNDESNPNHQWRFVLL